MCDCAESTTQCAHSLSDCGGLTFQDEGTSLPHRPLIDFVGAGVTASDLGGKTRVAISGGGGGTSIANSGPITLDGDYDTTGTDGAVIGVAIIVARDGGAIVKQATSPGTAQTGNWHVSGVGFADGALIAGANATSVDDLGRFANTDSARVGGIAYVGISGVGTGAAGDPVAQLRFGTDEGYPRASIGIFGGFGGTELWEDSGTFQISNLDTIRIVSGGFLSGQIDNDGNIFQMIHDNGPLSSGFLRMCNAAAGGSAEFKVADIGGGLAPEFSIFEGATDLTSDGTERMLISEKNTPGQMIFGDVAYHRTNPRLGEFQFVFTPSVNNVFNISHPAADNAAVSLSLRAPDSGGNGAGVQFRIGAKIGDTEDLQIDVGGGEVMRIIGSVANPENTNIVFGPVVNPSPLDDAMKTTTFWTATDSTLSASNVSVGIELPNSVGVAGDWVLRTGGTGASGSGTVTQITRGADYTTFFGTATPASDFPDLTAATVNIKTDGNSVVALRLSTGGVSLADITAGDIPAPLQIGISNGLDAAFFKNVDPNIDIINLGFSVYNSPATIPAQIVSKLQFQANGDLPAFFDFQFGSASPLHTFFEDGSATLGSTIGAPEAGIAARHATLPSALFQTSATDGSNANPTVKIDPNTAQTSPLLQVGIGSSFFGSADPATDFASNLPSVGIVAQGPGLMVTAGTFVWPGVNAPLMVSLNDTSATAATFTNADTSGAADFVQLRFKSFETPVISATGTLEFQNSGVADGKSWFGINFDWSNDDIFRFHSTGDMDLTGNVDAASYSVSDLNTAPASAAATGTKGEIRWVADAVYLCIDTDTWVKAALATWT